MKEADIEYAIRKAIIEIPFRLVDVKGYQNEYKLEVKFQIKIVSDFIGVVVE